MKIYTLKGVGDTGKTETVNLIFEKLQALTNVKRIDKTPSKKSNGMDFWATLLYNGKLIGFGSIGDTREEIEKNFEYFERHNCEIVVCAVRTKGGTQDYLAERENMGDTVDQTEKTNAKTAQNAANRQDAETLFRKLLSDLK